MRYRSIRPVIKAVHEMVHSQQDHTMEELAESVGIAASSLYSKLNPYDERELNMRQFLLLMDQLDPTPVLKAFCVRYGFKFIPADCPVPDGASVHEEMVHDHLAHAAFATAIQDGAPVEVTRELALKAIREIEETQSMHERAMYRPRPGEDE